MASSSPRPRSCPRAMPESRRRPATNARHGSMGGRQVLQRWRRAMAGSAWHRSLRVAALMSLIVLAFAMAAANASRWGKGYVPNHPVLAQDGKSFNFYDDLIQDRIAVVSFILYELQRNLSGGHRQAVPAAGKTRRPHGLRCVFLLHHGRSGDRHAGADARLCQDLRRRPRLAVPDR